MSKPHISRFLALLGIVVMATLFQIFVQVLLFDASLAAKAGDVRNANMEVPLQVQDNSPTSCKLSSERALSVILMALGRSGSSVTWDTMSALTGQRNVAYEITGGTPDTSKEFFSHLEKDLHQGHDWPVKRLCSLQENRDDLQGTGIVGFQWKPSMSSF